MQYFPENSFAKFKLIQDIMFVKNLSIRPNESYPESHSTKTFIGEE